MKKYIFLGISTVLILLIIICSVFFQENDREIPVSAYVRSGNSIEKISCWLDHDGIFYLFLPSYADLSDIQIENNIDSTVQIGFNELTDTMSLDGYSVGLPYRFVYKYRNHFNEATLVILQSAKLPTVYIETQSGTMDYIHTQKGNEEPGVIRVYSPEGILDYSGRIKGINGRGNATWEKSEKKPYSLKLENEADLLGMGMAEKWILLANAQDPSHIRNKLAADLASSFGLMYTAETEWVDLYLNGCYVGLYLLSERNEVHPQRVDLIKNSFLVSMEKKNG